MPKKGGGVLRGKKIDCALYYVIWLLFSPVCTLEMHVLPSSKHCIISHSTGGMEKISIKQAADV